MAIVLRLLRVLLLSSASLPSALAVQSDESDAPGLAAAGDDVGPLRPFDPTESRTGRLDDVDAAGDDAGLRRTQRELFVKLQYLFRL